VSDGLKAPAVIEGNADAHGLRVAIVATRYNEPIVERLRSGAVAALTEHGARSADLAVVLVPGAYELPLAARKLAASGRYDAVVALGAVVRGDTPHFDYVAGECAAGITRAMADTGVPIGFGVLTVDTLEQAVERAGGRVGNKGAEAALAAIEMAQLLQRLEE
jgi:6,7-dimethyl-8-ribityllumazine synthase